MRRATGARATGGGVSGEIGRKTTAGRGRLRRLAGLAAAFWLAVLAACARPMLGIGDVIEGVPDDSVAMRLVLIGDAGLPAPGGEPVLEALREELKWDPQRTLVVYLGDNVYPRGLVDSATAERAEGERILREQMEPLLETGTRGIFIPGNHDWDAGSPQGWAAILREERFVEAHGRDLIRFFPGEACPGPTVLDFDDYLRLIVMDTQWWLHGPAPGKPYGSGSHCRARTEEEIIDSLRVDLASAGTRRTVVVGHHPIATGGEHGGYFDWPTYLFPFHPWARLGGFFARQDVSGREYRTLIRSFERAFAASPPMLYAAGHEHNLQVFRRDPARYQLVSGGGIYNHTTRVRAITGTRYTRRASGYMRLSFLRDGRVRLSVQVVDAEGKAQEDFSTWVEEERIERAAPVVPGAAERPAPAPAPAPPPGSGTRP